MTLKTTKRNNTSGESRRRRRRIGLRVAVSSLALAVVAGVALLSVTARGGNPPAESVAAQAGGELPAFARASSATLAGYQSAVANQDLFMKMPCYCGCGMHTTAHHNLKECFIKPDGTYESHASACQTCVNIATDVMTLKGQGLSAKDIRQNVDAKYSKYGPSTDTPPITDS
jgi:hypothetical protein